MIIVQPAHHPREAADLARVDHRHRQAGHGETDLHAAGGLEHDQRWGKRA
jgi:hypothetical protein